MHKSYNLQKACTIDKSLLFDTLALIFRFWNEKIDVIHSFFRMGSILQIFLTMHKCIKIKTTSCINYVFPFLLCVVKKKSVTLKKTKQKKHYSPTWEMWHSYIQSNYSGNTDLNLKIHIMMNFLYSTAQWLQTLIDYW